MKERTIKTDKESPSKTRNASSSNRELADTANLNADSKSGQKLKASYGISKNAPTKNKRTNDDGA